jgi:hypothetical protein
MLDVLAELGGRVTLRTLSTIKRDWGISIKALVARFQALGVIDAAQARSLYKQISSRGWNKQEPVPAGNEHAIWLAKAIGRWSGGKAEPICAAADAIGLGERHLHRWLDWSPTGEDRGMGDLVELRQRPRRSSAAGQERTGSVTALPVRRA